MANKADGDEKRKAPERDNSSPEHHKEHLAEHTVRHEQDSPGHAKRPARHDHGSHDHAERPGQHDHSSHDHSEKGHDMQSHGMTEHGGHQADFKRRFFISLVFAVPVLLLSPMMGVELPFQLSFPGSDWLVLAASSLLFFYGGKPFLTGAVAELSGKRPAMMTLIALGITTSYLYSLYALITNTFFPQDEHLMDFFWELATLTVIMLLGHWVEMRAISGAGDALRKMAQLLPAQAHLQKPDKSFADIPLSQVSVGQIVQVKGGEKVPVDGIVVAGATSVDESMVTGEAKEVSKQVGDKVIGGSVNGMGSVLVEVTGAGDSGYLAQVMALVSAAQSEKSKIETLSDRVARWLFFVALTVGIAAFAIWLVLTSSFSDALTRLVTVLVIACPHALGLAVPLVVARSTSIGAENGLLVRNREALEKAPGVTMVFMDKTGTLTEGRFKVAETRSFDSQYSTDDILAIMAGMESGSSHPLARGIVQEASARGILPAQASDIQIEPGSGLVATSEGRQMRITTAAWLEKHHISYDKDLLASLGKKGFSISYLVADKTSIGLVAQGDHVKKQAKPLIEDLQRQGIVPVMLTGDNEETAKRTALLLGIKTYQANMRPEDKVEAIRKAREDGQVVMMVGDGINDAPSLTQADVGVAIGSGTDIAIDAADVILVKNDPSDIMHFLSLAKATTRKIVQNLWWGAGYNIVAIPLAAGILAPVGILLTPAVGAVLMSASTLIVAANALLLRPGKTGF